MKKLILVLALMTGLTAMGQKGSNGHKKGKMSDMTPEQMATLQSKRLTLELDLNEAQQDQVYQLALQNATMRKAKKEAMQKRKESDDFEKPTADERYKMQNARLEHQIAQKEKMKKILSAEQYAKWEKMREKQKGHAKKHLGKKFKKERK